MAGSRQRLMNLDVPDAAIVDMEKSRNVPDRHRVDLAARRRRSRAQRIEGWRGHRRRAVPDRRSIAGLGRIIDVAERDVGCAVGQPATSRRAAFPARIHGIDVIYPEINKETRTRASHRTANPDWLLHDMYVDADQSAASRRAAFRKRVMDTGRGQAVLVDKGEGRFEPREVKLGHRGDGYVEVREGVSEGEPVVVSANFLIDAESNLKAALKGFAEGAQP
jgi:Cu(I)/Ag(I) efflux system membrane fusion protein